MINPRRPQPKCLENGRLAAGLCKSVGKSATMATSIVGQASEGAVGLTRLQNRPNPRPSRWRAGIDHAQIGSRVGDVADSCLAFERVSTWSCVQLCLGGSESCCQPSAKTFF